ncbi:Calcium/proton exchanger [Parathielavia hyrcaniae]|uniref:Calcium/proton exchanger n=1 Tax=Parathielavia hyrcaniae TaxID=113614 RepID=A0AAN6QAC1_9PEZI|nr:Calcium/proton exchanger [Parathielavia hyrcaniae]
MSSYNTYHTRMAAFREASRDSLFGNTFPRNRTRRSESLSQSQTWHAGNQLEGQPLAPTNTEPHPPTSFGSSSQEPPASRPEIGESSAQVDAQGHDIDTGPATITQAVLRRRTSAGREELSVAAAEQAQDTEKPKQSRTFFKHLTPKEPYTVRNQIERTLFNSWINVLLLAAPAGITLNYVPSVGGVVVFIVNFIAIVPLAAMLGFATEEIALRTGETMGGLLNATFGNAVELIVAIIALAHNEIVIVQTSLIGSILSNLLLVLGMCFFFGGLRRQEQYFNTTVAQTAASLLALAVAAVIVPTVFDISSKTPQSDVAKLSRGTSVILLIVYGGYLFFQLKTHSTVFAQESQKVAAKPFRSPDLREGAIAQGFVAPAGVLGGHGLPSSGTDNEKLRSLLTKPPRKALQDEDDDQGEEDGEEPQLHFWVAIGALTVSTVVVALCAEFMVDAIGAVTAGGTVSQEFVGLILLPIVGNAAEHFTAVTVAVKDKMDLAIGVAVGSSMQVALFLIPLLVVIGWGMGVDDMALSFDPFQVAVLFVAVLLVNYLIADGKSHWLEGMLLICLYSIIAVCSWWYPAAAAEKNE